jgi:hypothetical protein
MAPYVVFELCHASATLHSLLALSASTSSSVARHHCSQCLPCAALQVEEAIAVLQAHQAKATRPAGGMKDE